MAKQNSKTEHLANVAISPNRSQLLISQQMILLSLLFSFLKSWRWFMIQKHGSENQGVKSSKIYPKNCCFSLNIQLYIAFTWYPGLNLSNCSCTKCDVFRASKTFFRFASIAFLILFIKKQLKAKSIFQNIKFWRYLNSALLCQLTQNFHQILLIISSFDCGISVSVKHIKKHIRN